VKPTPFGYDLEMYSGHFKLSPLATTIAMFHADPPNKTFGARPLPYPGITRERRVVLDLSFRGYGTSADIVDPKGELLAIADPDAKYDPVPGAIVVRAPLGVAVQKLLLAGARFDLIVCDVPPGSTTPAVGIFAPAAPPLARSGRKLILPGVVKAKPVESRIGLAQAVWQATQSLLSVEGEALLRVPKHEDLAPGGNSMLENVWWAHWLEASDSVSLYVQRGCGATGVGVYRAAPREQDRLRHTNAFFATSVRWTPGQRELFCKTLLNK